MMAGISKHQEKILEMITSEYLTAYQIASRLKISHQAVYKTIKKLRKKGLFGFSYKGVAKKGGLLKLKGVAKTHILRLHNIQESLKILSISKRYIAIMNRSNKMEISGFTILLYKDNIQIYTQKVLSFSGYSTDECYSKAILEFSYLYAKIESRLSIIIDKEGYLNHKWVRQHIAETDNEIAKEANEKKERIVLRKNQPGEDGKAWLITDKSFKGNELEFIHPETAKQDTDRIKKQLDDFRLHDPVTNSELAKTLMQFLQTQGKANTDTNSVISAIASNLQSVSSAQLSLSEIVKNLIPKINKIDNGEKEQDEGSSYIG